ncbi:hypothetical protein [Miltoncostaea oceani]|uniref:hypothetical protein n=1 Tax=Miltoncostaea oceani TaxID=2843216 RepID=UPI001C3D3510|nr:hypothetical protein [Miltoncostaea oceani]
MTSERDHPTADRRVVRVYLGDHLAVMHGGAALAARMLDAPHHRDAAGLIAEVAAELAAGCGTVRAFLGQLGGSPPRLKMLAMGTVERIGRIKMNGRVARRSPLSEVLELEALRGAVGTAGAFWAAVERAGFAARTPVRDHAERCADLGPRVEEARLAAAARVLAPDAPAREPA